MNPFLYRVVYRTVGKVIKGFRAIGLDIRPMTGPHGKSVGMRLQWHEEDGKTLRGSVVSTHVNGDSIRFFVENDMDVIQSHHRRGCFYEQEELDIIAGAFKGGVFVDIGSNVGNHAIYALKFLNADKVISFEPHPIASAILEINIALNNLSDKFLLHKVGLSNQAGTADFQPLNNNLGATRLSVLPSGGDLVLARGDDLLAAEKVDFIKIDTEGFEVQVLEGLEAVLQKERPGIFVEVEDGNLAAVEAFFAKNGYRIQDQYRRYETLVNILAVPDSDIVSGSAAV